MPAYRILPPVVIALNLKRLYCADKPSTVILLSCRNVCRFAVLQCGLLQGHRAECFSGSSADLQDTQAVIIPTTSPKWSLFTLLLRTKKENALNHNPDKYFTKKETQPMHLSTKKAEDLKERLSQIPGTRMAQGKRHRKILHGVSLKKRMLITVLP